MTKGSLRDQMPVVADWIDKMRDAFGKEHIDAQIRAGIKGKPVFFARENGSTVGTPVKRGWRVLKDKRGNPTIVVQGDNDRDSGRGA